MTALLLAAMVGLSGGDQAPRLLDVTLDPPAGAAGDAANWHPALHVAAQLGAGIGITMLSVPSIYFVAWAISGFGLLDSVSLVAIVMGMLFLPPTAAAGTVWAIADLDRRWQPDFRKLIGVSATLWAGVLVAGGIWYGSFWKFLVFGWEPSVYNPLQALPYVLLSSAVLTTGAVITHQFTKRRRARPTHWRRYRDPEPELGLGPDPFPATRQTSHAPPHVSVPLWAGVF